MSAKIFEIINDIGKQKLYKAIACQCSPLITGIKISNLLIVKSYMEQEVINIFKNTKISLHVLHKSNNRTTFFAYREEALNSYLNEKNSIRAMNKFGYETNDLSSIFSDVCKKYDYFMKHKKEFPHQIGILLGYPVEDVLGFMNNKGMNYLYSGYWKVYGDVKKSIETFESYDKAKKEVAYMVSNGISIKNILNIYYINQNKAINA